ncbi:glutamate receptor ionotropic, delta-2 isoform X1 [Patella vulgata]|uniref:glutamate receptor ionotropic, delta-2 isoform X1 n=1 Tax=Patella vulgata TaxID=6465 RepID=UPI0024A8590B|nr:glutamate receptor ionotropic, delta-2 isoform X1 [Patella vulgata]
MNLSFCIQKVSRGNDYTTEINTVKALNQACDVINFVNNGINSHFMDVVTVPKVDIFQPDVKQELMSQSYCKNFNDTPLDCDFHLVSNVIGSHLSKLMVSTMKNLKWQKIAIIYDSFYEEEISELVLSLATIQIQCVLLKFDNVSCDNILPRLKKIYIDFGGGNMNLLLMCSSTCTATVLSQANRYNEYYGQQSAFDMNTKWLIASTMVNKCILEDSSLVLDNVAVFNDYKIRSTRYRHPITIVENLMTETIINYKRNCSLDQTCNVPISVEKEYFINYTIQLFQGIMEQKSFSISTLMWAENDRRELRKVGCIRDHDAFNLGSAIFPNANFGFNKRKFVVSTNPWPPFVNKKTTNTSVKYSGFCLDLLQELAISLNFSYTLIEPPDMEWGRLLNGNWTGLIGQLAREDVDLVVAPISISTERETVMDFTQPYFYEKTGLGMRRPDPNKTKWRRLVEPLTWQVLLCIGISFLVISILFSLIERYNPFYTTKGKKRGTDITRQVQAKIWYLFGALLAHGGNHVTQSSSGRFLIGFWWLFCMVMAATYSGNLVAFLTVTKDKPPFTSLAGMIQQDDYIWGTIGGTVIVQLLQTSNRSDYRQVWSGIEKFSQSDPGILSLSGDDHLERVLAGDYVFLGDYTLMEIWETQYCDLFTIEEHFFPMQFGLGLLNNSAYTTVFTDNLLKIYESGLVQIWKKRWWPNSTSCGTGRNTQIKAVDLLSLQSAFYVIAIGIWLAVIALIIEVLPYFRKKMNN